MLIYLIITFGHLPSADLPSLVAMGALPINFVNLGINANLNLGSMHASLPKSCIAIYRNTAKVLIENGTTFPLHKIEKNRAKRFIEQTLKFN